MSHSIDAPGSGSGDALTSIGSGTDNTIPLWNGTSALDDSAISQTGTAKLLFPGAGDAGNNDPSISFDGNTTTGFNTAGGQNLVRVMANNVKVVDFQSTLANFSLAISSASTISATGNVSSSAGNLTAGGASAQNAVVTIGNSGNNDRVQLQNTNITKNYTLNLPNVATTSDLVAYTDTFASGTIPLLGDGAGTGVTGEISNSSMVQDASGDINLASGKHHLITGGTAGYFVTDTNNGIINYGANNWGLLHNGNAHVQFLSNTTRFNNGYIINILNTAGDGSIAFDIADMPAVPYATRIKASNLDANTGNLQLPAITRNSTIDIIKEEATEALTVANSTVSSGAEVTTAGTSTDMTAGVGNVTSINGNSGAADVVQAEQESAMEAQGSIIKVSTSFTPNSYGGAVLTPVLPPYGNVIIVTTDGTYTRNFPANTTVPNGHEVTVHMTSTTGNTTTIEGESVVDNAADTATFIKTSSGWITKVAPHAG
jgi:hypothetical protein